MSEPAPPTTRPTPRGAAVLIGLLCAVLGFALAVQVRSNREPSALASARQEDLVRILDDLQSRESRLRAEIADLEAARQRLSSGSGQSQAALAEARRRASDLGVLAGTLPAQGPGVVVTLRDPDGRLRADLVLDAVEELRGAGAEALDVGGVRVGLSTAFTDAAGDGGRPGVAVDGTVVTPPYVLTAIGDPATMAAALDIPGGVVDTVRQAGGSAEVEQRRQLTIRSLRPLEAPQYARPAPDGG